MTSCDGCHATPAVNEWYHVYATLQWKTERYILFPQGAFFEEKVELDILVAKRSVRSRPL